MEDIIHESHEGSWGIGQAKGHDCEFKVPIPSAEGCLGYVLLSYPDLVVARCASQSWKRLWLLEPCPRAHQCEEGDSDFLTVTLLRAL